VARLILAEIALVTAAAALVAWGTLEAVGSLAPEFIRRFVIA